MPNTLTVQNVRAEPGVIPAAGGKASVTFEANVSTVAENASVSIALQGSVPYRLVQGGASTAKLTTTSRTVRQPVLIERTSAKPPMSYIILETTVAVSGDSRTRSCFVYLDDPLKVQLSALRAESGDSQQTLADQIGVSRSVISRAERGLGLSPQTEAKIAGLLK